MLPALGIGDDKICGFLRYPAPQLRMGARSAETERIYQEFTAGKLAIETRARSLRDELKSAERLNKALKIGRVPAMVITLLQAIEDAGLGQHFTVVGTHALYAYESAAGGRRPPSIPFFRRCG